MSLQRIPATAPLQQIVDALELDGGLIVEGMFPTATIEEIRNTVAAHAKDFAPGAATQGLGPDGKAFVGDNTIRFSSLGKITPAFLNYSIIPCTQPLQTPRCCPTVAHTGSTPARPC